MDEVALHAVNQASLSFLMLMLLALSLIKVSDLTYFSASSPAATFFV